MGKSEGTIEATLTAEGRKLITDLLYLSDSDLKLIFEEAEKAAQESVLSYRNLVDKSYLLISIYLGILAFYFTRLEKGPTTFIIIAFTIAAVVLVFLTLTPKKINFVGCSAEEIIPTLSTRLEGFGRLFMARRIYQYNEAVSDNLSKVDRMQHFYVSSIFLVGSGYFISFLIASFGPL